MAKTTGRETLLAGASLFVLAAGLAAPEAPSAAQCTAGAITASCTNAASIGPLSVPNSTIVGSITNTGSGTITTSGTIVANFTAVVAGITNSGGLGTLSNAGSIGAIGTITAFDGTNTAASSGYYKVIAGVGNLATITVFDNSGTITGAVTQPPPNSGFDNRHNRIVGLFNAGTITNFVNEAGALIDGSLGGVDNWAASSFAVGTIQTLTNLGTINSGSRTGLINEGLIGTLTNTGLIHGNVSGVWAAGGTINTLTNTGTISAGVEAISVSGGSYVDSPVGAIGTLVNQAGGTISGGGTGIDNGGSIGRISNSGLISGGTSAGVRNINASTIGTIVNSGIISSSHAGISNDGTIGTITNSGTIGGIATLGIYNTGTLSALTNSGLIDGAVYAIDNQASGTLVSISNSGTIAGNIRNLSARDLTISGGSGSTIGTLTGASGGLGTADRGVINNTLSNLVLASGNQLLNDNITVGSTHTVTTGATITLINPITITGNYAQTAGGLIINAPSGTTGYGYLTVTGNAGVSNTAITISGTGLTSGEEFTIVRAGGTGAYASDTATVTGTSGLIANIVTIGNNLLVDVETALACSGVIGTSCNNTASIGSIVVQSGTSIGSFTNASIISGGTIGLLVQGTVGSIGNSGTISISGLQPNASYGVNVTGTVGTLTNSGVIRGDTPLSVSGTVGTLVNSGRIGNIGNTDGIFVQGHIGTLTNSGTIIGWNGTSNITILNNGIFNTVGSIGLLNNAAGGTILGASGVRNENSTISTLVNAGTIVGTLSIGVGIGNSGTTGSIGAINNSGLITGGSYAINNSGTLGAITNGGVIAGNIVNSSAQDLTINGGTGSTFGTLTGYSGTVGTITNSGGNVVLGSGNLALNDHVNVGAGTVVALGTISLANPISITGSYAQNTGGLEIDVTNGTSYGYLTVSGDATVSNTAITIAGTGLNGGESFTIVRPGGADAYVNDSVVVSGASGLTATYSIVGNALVVTLAGTTITNTGGGGTPPSTTITNTGSSGGYTGTLSGGTKVGVSIGSTITNVINSGTIGATGTVSGGTIVTGNNGAVANRGTVTNFTNSGTILGQGGATSGGIGLYSGSGNSVTEISNGSGGVIAGNTAAIQNQGGVGTLGNAGTVTSKAPTGVSNLSGGIIGTLSNSGSIAGLNNGIYNQGSIATVSNTGSIASQGSGTVSGNNAAVVNAGSVTNVTNSGTIVGQGGATIGGVGISSSGSIGGLTNSAGGVIFGNTAAIQNQGGLGTLGNSGTVTSKAPTGIINVAGGTIGTLSNAGTILGTGAGINSAGTIGTLTNVAGGLISGDGVAVKISSGAVGTITNAGAILDAPSGTLNSVIGGVANQGSIGSLSNSGLISGTGGATIAGAGLQNASGASVTALSNIATGTIGGNSAGVLNQGGIATLSNAGTITSAAPTGIANTGTIGALDNSGSIVGTSFALTNSGLIGPITDEGFIGAVSNSGTINGLQIASGASIGVITNSGTINGNIVNNGAAALSINGASSGFGTLTGGSITSAAGLIMNAGNQVLLDNVNVGSGTFAVTGGRLSLIHQQSISGNYLQTGGALLVTVNNSSSYGSLAVSGKATVSNTVIELTAAGFHPGEKLAVVTAGGGGTYTGDSVEWLNAGTALSPVLLVTADTLYVTLPTYSQVGRSIDKTGGVMGAVLDRLSAESTPPAYLDSISLLPGAAQGEAIRQLAPTQIPASEVISSGMALAMGAIADHPQTLADAPHHTAIWGQMLNGGAQRNTADDAEGYRSSSFGFSTGVETVLGPNNSVGAAFSWIRGWASGNAVASGQSLSADSYFVTLYDRLGIGQAYIDAQASYGWSNFSERRGIGFLDSTASANYDGHSYLGRLGAGYDLDLGGVTVTPIAGVTALRVETPSYSEAGAGAVNLSVASNGVNEITHDIGAKVTWTMPTPIGTLSPLIKAEWLHDYTHNPILTSGVLGDQGFTVGTARPGQDGLRLGYGLTLDNRRDLSFRIEGESDIRPDYQSHSAILKVILGF